MADPDSASVDAGNPMSVSMIYVTCASVNEAREIARSLVAERLIACANIIDGMQSVYWWQGQVAEDSETVLLLKTRADRVETTIARVRALHGYEVPCVVELPLARGNPAYLDWIAAEASGGAG
jgi:periplasmic divalent cation tolerance protein